MTFAARGVMELILAAVCVVLAFTAPHFLSGENLLNILRSVSMQGIIAFGMTMVIICGEIDLSVGSAAAFAGCLLAYLIQKGLPVPFCVAATIAAGVMIGAFTGVMRVRFKVPSFITTLALFTGLNGLSLMITGGFPIRLPDWFQVFGGGVFPVLVFAVAFAAVHFIMRNTTFGCSVYATGGNDEAARLSGINVGCVRTAVFAVTGGLAAVSGMMLAGRIGSGSPKVAQGWELDAIAAVIIGGTSFSGGVGSVWGTLIGVVFIGVIINGMTLLNVPIYTQHIMRGGLILLAVLVNQIQETRG